MVLVQTNGRGFSFQILIQARMSASRAGTFSCTPRWSSLVVSSPNQRSTLLSQDELVGMKCMWKRECAASQFWIMSVLWMA